MENQLINITNKDDQQLVSARDLHKGLKVKKRFSQWVDQNFKSFKEGRDWEGVLKSTPYNPNYPEGQQQQIQDYAITVDMAKHIAMMSRTKMGAKFRDYFIEVEKAWNDPKAVIERHKELTAHKTPEEMELAKNELAYKKEWLEEMKRQNRNKEHELRNDDVKLLLKIADMAEDYGNDSIAVDYRREAIKSLNGLPVREKHTLFTATEIAQVIGVDAYTIGTWGRKLSLIGDKHYTHHGLSKWYYFESALKEFKDHAHEIQDYYAEKRLGV